MTKYPLSLFSLLLIASILLSGCATPPNKSSQENSQTLTPKQRTQLLIKKEQWQVKGKIAFIQKNIGGKGKDKRESATLSWQVNQQEQTQKLNLTSYLGINVLQLESEQNQHTINVDGKTYHGNNLSELIYSLTGLPLPTQALNFWLKGLPYNSTDTLKVYEQTQLPQSISSYYHNALWHIHYDNYQTFNGIEMATKITLTKENLLIKVAINNWDFND